MEVRVTRVLPLRPASLATAVAIAGLVASPANAVDGLSGSPAAVKLAERVLASTRKVKAVLWKQHGGIYECPRRSAPPSVAPAGRAPARGCRVAAVTFEQNLERGRIASQLSRVSARGLPILEQLTDGAGDWLRVGSGVCWTRIGRGEDTVQAVTYSGERLTITSQSKTSAVLEGTSPGFREVDTIDLRTELVVRIVGQEVTSHGISRADSVFSYPSTRFRQPAPKPLC